MCFSSTPAVPATPTAADYAYYDAAGKEVPGNSTGATRRLGPTPFLTSIMGGAWGGEGSVGGPGTGDSPTSETGEGSATGNM